MMNISAKAQWLCVAVLAALLLGLILPGCQLHKPPEPKVATTPRQINAAMLQRPARITPSMPVRIGDIQQLPLVGHCITAVTQDLQGRWWIGTEGQGIYCFAPHAGKSGRPEHFTSRNNAPNNVYALACDDMGRVWAGSLRHGVCVYSGGRWRDYDVIAGLGYGRATAVRGAPIPPPAPGGASDNSTGRAFNTSGRAGPLGARIFAIATSGLNGNVWIATCHGLTRYRLHRNIWQYYTTAQGLPSNAITCLACAPDGTLFVGTQTSGIAYSSPSSHYRRWHHISGPLHLPLTPTGPGLPCNLINALLVVPQAKIGGQWHYTLYAGTDAGLAIGTDNGHRWRFIRGRNYLAKIKGLWHVPARYDHPTAAQLAGLVSSDQITALAEDAAGNIWIGHRTTGYEVWNQNGRPTLPPGHPLQPTPYVASLAPLANGGMLVGGYETGCFHVTEQAPGPTARVIAWRPHVAPPLPAGAWAPSQFALEHIIATVQSGQGAAVTAAFLGQDWRTQGDWLGHYGVNYARLCAGTPQFNNAEEQFFGGLGGADIWRESSPHQYAGDVAYYVAWYHSPLLRTLYFPQATQRIEAEWNDAGGRYPRLYDGPDMWLRVKIPAGLYRLSFYFHNKDNHNGENDLRDYVVQVYPKDSSPAVAWATQRPLAQGRVMQFWGGMYISFVLKGPGAYQVRLKRNYGHWMTVAGMFLDRLSGPKGLAGYTNLDGLPLKNYRPASFAPTAAIAATPAWRLWQLLNQRRSYSRSDLAWQWPGRVLAYRYAQAHHFPRNLLAHWRWRLCLWTPADRQAFNHAIGRLAKRANGRN